MATKKVGVLVKEARTAAKLTQEKLGKAAGVTANEIGKLERGEIDLSAAQLKKIAVACGVTQTSLVNAPKNLSAAAAKKATAAAKTTAAKTTAAKTTAAKKTTTAKTAAAKKTTTAKTTAKKTESKTTAAKKTATAKKTGDKTTTAKKTEAKKPATPASANTSMKVTAAEKKLIEAYRTATSDNKKISLKVLKGEYGETALNLLNMVGGAGGTASNAADNIGDKIGSLLGNLISGGK
jgi:transcriptional regulator with XRE-family HTH domain